MKNQNVTEGDINAHGHRYAIIAGRFNSFVVDRLVTGAINTLKEAGCDEADISVYKAPGGFELPLAAHRIAKAGGVDAIIALGAVIRGDTPHFDFVAAEASRGLSDVAMNHDIPVANGVLTCDTVEQALIRAGEEPAEETEVDQKKKPGNKGREAALAAIEMVNLLKAIGEG